ncbi:MAG: N-acetylmuramoyl-L-alanine amidase, partial [Calditrichaeota bacterium]
MGRILPLKPESTEMRTRAYFILFLSLLLYWGCASRAIKWRDWKQLPKEHYALPPYAKYLAGFKIALDPGHGGLGRLPGYKRGPSGKREAIMNLNVALYLKAFLEKAGCDFMISLHHNASSNPQTNFPAVFYHQAPDSSPVSLDLARNIYFGLAEALHLPQISEEGLLADKYIYPAGFGLLRRAHIPA